MVQDANGYWRPAPKMIDDSEAIQEAARRREADRAVNARRIGRRGIWGDPYGLAKGSKHFLVLLVEFADLHFQSGAKDHFSNAMNGEGFSYRGSVGSAKDYWKDNSNGVFNPTFDVLGPVTLSFNHNAFPSNDDKYHSEFVRNMIKEALASLDASVNFAIYDNTGDGYIDNIYLLYPGYAQSNGGGENTIWPHSSSVYDSSKSYDGVRTASYACSAELVDNTGTTFNGIGTFCHEFGHVLGLPDLYDTDYEEHGNSRYPSSYNLMASGNHNYDGLIPPYLSTMERSILGYLSLDAMGAGEATLSPVQDNHPYVLNTPTSGEFFILEVRNAQKWDSGINNQPKGLLIYHTDQSANIVGNNTAAYLWENTNTINIYADHPCHYILVPDESAYDGNAIYFPELWVYPTFPGYYYVNYTSLTTWSGSSPYRLESIAYDSGKVSLNVIVGDRVITGLVTDALTGNPVSGAVVSIAPQTVQPSNAGGVVMSRAARRNVEYGYTYTNEKGQYSYNIDGSLPTMVSVGVYADEYIPSIKNVDISASADASFSISPMLVRADVKSIYKYYYDGSYGYWGWSKEGHDHTGAVKYSAEELNSYVGHKLQSISFSYKESAEKVAVFVDFGTSERVFFQELEKSSPGLNVTNTVDVSSYDITIPEGRDVYVGYALKSASGTYAFYTDFRGAAAPEGSFMYAFTYSDTPPSVWSDAHADWDGADKCSLLISFTLSAPDSLNENTTIESLGFNYIQAPASTLKAGDSFPLNLACGKTHRPSNVTWYYDNQLVDGSSVTLTSGEHTVKAILQYTDAVDTVQLKLKVD